MLSSQQPWEVTTQQAQNAYQAGRYAEAERLFSTALKQAESFGEKDERFLSSIVTLAGFYSARGEWRIAERLFSRAIDSGICNFGPDSSQVAVIKRRYEAILLKQRTVRPEPKIEHSTNGGYVL